MLQLYAKSSPISLVHQHQGGAVFTAKGGFTGISSAAARADFPPRGRTCGPRLRRPVDPHRDQVVAVGGTGLYTGIVASTAGGTEATGREVGGPEGGAIGRGYQAITVMRAESAVGGKLVPAGWAHEIGPAGTCSARG